MPTDASDSVRVDDIWKSLKEEYSISTKKRGPLKDINHLWETTKGGSSSTSASTSTASSTSASQCHIFFSVCVVIIKTTWTQ